MYARYEVRPLPARLSNLNGISARTITEHYKLYEGYVNKVNEIREKLSDIDVSSGNATFSELRALKRGESFALDGAKLHELYFEQLGGKGCKPSPELLRGIQAQYGSHDRFLAEMSGAGLSARGWAILAFDPAQNELFVYITDDQHNGHVIQTIPILPLDVFEHAYYIDYGTNRSGYLSAFFENLDWTVVSKRYLQALRLVRPRFRIGLR